MNKKPLVEVRVEDVGFIVRESLPQSFKIDHPVQKMVTSEQWCMLYENLLDFDVKEGDLTGFFSYVQDPLLMLHYLLQRADDPELDTRGCLATKYPV